MKSYSAANNWQSLALACVNDVDDLEWFLSIFTAPFVKKEDGEATKV